MAEQIRPHVRDLTVIPPESLPHWLPGLGVPVGWSVASVNLEPSQPARVLTLPSSVSPTIWEGCEVLNLFRFTGTPPARVVSNSADRTLKDLGANEPITYRMTMPPGLGIVAMRSRGTTAVAALRRLWVQVTNFVVTTAGDSALIEHTVLIDARSRTRLAPDITLLGDSVRRALLASIHDAQQTS
ncbi:hypothetical protein [Mycolicibacterium peregrinum]|uniref:Uncharacterized protein n=1 Tax=Mycolicibacterium peregrinum TaxID=43304 RepID=A0A4Z0HU87_MYCPR|nr:hypothetical protein [Mycolicibacterium peregrinum]TGB44628.1 hypothetical protein EJD94_08910 [Mycolicibacterium peregrinum]TGB46961.1 hypothetical protein EJD98_03590 [Mycolicibacterium peregrinum]